MERLGIVLESVRGVGAAWKVLECVGMVLGWIGGCWNGLEWCWSGAGVAWNSVGGC